jgi:hypothetical protein
MSYRNAVGLAGIALVSLISLSWQAPKKPSLCPTRVRGQSSRAIISNLARINSAPWEGDDITVQESREIDRLYRQLEANSREMAVLADLDRTCTGVCRKAAQSLRGFRQRLSYHRNSCINDGQLSD